ncbi:ABC transporter ATP-binding protein [Falsiroseomonas ponticola]|uniref:ABC transporter ATP-binding protein n=1 Tax=Falsiroseomonas ponticola TaxID=2786951 RepID=UPI001933F581|nr:ABC transporter ATP-binding protein [Roseomonas ponticola]
MRIACRGVSLSYPAGRGSNEALRGIDLEIGSGEFVGVLGRSGCGKSSLLSLIAGLRQPSAGSIAFPGFTGAGRPSCLMAFQSDGLMPWLSVLDNVAFGLEAAGMARAERERRAQLMLRRMQLDGFAAQFPGQLSGGMRQRVGLARLFVREADALLMDEPFAAVDAQTRLLLQQELLDIWTTQQRTVVYVTHDIEEAILLCDRLVVLSARPARVLAEVKVPLPRPRRLACRQPEEVAALRWHVWNLLAAQDGPAVAA